MPFANLEFPKGMRKRHGIGGPRSHANAGEVHHGRLGLLEAGARVPPRDERLPGKESLLTEPTGRSGRGTKGPSMLARHGAR
jgi:hypothetical protein